MVSFWGWGEIGVGSASIFNSFFLRETSEADNEEGDEDGDGVFF